MLMSRDILLHPSAVAGIHCLDNSNYNNNEKNEKDSENSEAQEGKGRGRGRSTEHALGVRHPPKYFNA